MSETSCCGPSIVCRTGKKAVLLLRFYEDLSVDQTAELLGCSVGTVKSRTARALQQLRMSPHLDPLRRALIAMELDELRQAFSRREAAAPTLHVDPDELIRQGRRAGKRRTLVLAASCVAVAVIVTVAGVIIGTGPKGRRLGQHHHGDAIAGSQQQLRSQPLPALPYAPARRRIG